MGHLEERVRARGTGFDRLNSLTTWIGLAAVAAVGVFGVIAAATIPGKASPAQNPGEALASTSNSTSTNTGFSRHHESSGLSVSSGPPVAVSGASR